MAEVLAPSLPGARMRYYSTLATIMHVWRDNAVDLFLCWVAEYTARSAHDCGVHAVPPRSISGRRGQKSACEKFLLLKDVDKLAVVFPKAVKTRGYYQTADAAEAQASAAAAGAKKKARGKRTLDETQADDKDNFETSLGTWSKRSAGGILDPRFWFMLKVRAKLSLKLDRMLWSLQEASSVNGDMNSELSSLAIFVFEKAGAVYEGIKSLLDASEWLDIKGWARVALGPQLGDPEAGCRALPHPPSRFQDSVNEKQFHNTGVMSNVFPRPSPPLLF